MKVCGIKRGRTEMLHDSIDKIYNFMLKHYFGHIDLGLFADYDYNQSFMNQGIGSTDNDDTNDNIDLDDEIDEIQWMGRPPDYAQNWMDAWNRSQINIARSDHNRRTLQREQYEAFRRQNRRKKHRRRQSHQLSQPHPSNANVSNIQQRVRDSRMSDDYHNIDIDLTNEDSDDNNDNKENNDNNDNKENTDNNDNKQNDDNNDEQTHVKHEQIPFDHLDEYDENDEEEDDEEEDEEDGEEPEVTLSQQYIPDLEEDDEEEDEEDDDEEEEEEDDDDNNNDDDDNNNDDDDNAGGGTNDNNNNDDNDNNDNNDDIESDDDLSEEGEDDNNDNNDAMDVEDEETEENHLVNGRYVKGNSESVNIDVIVVTDDVSEENHLVNGTFIRSMINPSQSMPAVVAECKQMLNVPDVSLATTTTPTTPPPTTPTTEWNSELINGFVGSDKSGKEKNGRLFKKLFCSCTDHAVSPSPDATESTATTVPTIQIDNRSIKIYEVSASYSAASGSVSKSDTFKLIDNSSDDVFSESSIYDVD